jgi:hypothetical protein
MRTFFFHFFFIFSVNLFQAQEIKEDEYKVYSTYIGEQGLIDYPIVIGIPDQFRINAKFNDSLATVISELPVYNFDHKKLKSMSLEYDLVDPENKRISFDPNLIIYFSPINFISSNEGYFITVYDNKKIKPFYFLFKVQKVNNKWNILDYNNVY